ncbi:MAG: protein kinase [Gemmatimonas sp.]
MTNSALPDSANDWERIKDTFHAALEHPANSRLAFVNEACGDAPRLRAQVESLLAAHDESTDFLETPAVALPGASQFLLDATQRVGPYRLLKEIGRGGMGTVHLATRDDGQFAQRVAVKLVKRGMDTDAILARFRHERQILAALEHPNIARLLDGGTTEDGVPYFVMEYVQGRSIRDYCETRALSVADRIALFRTVCAAVQYAHQNLIVHRDIKSSNIIVTDDGVPKLLDFGIAKLLHPTQYEDASVATDTINAMTPEYASPEQLRGEPVTTATDVYSLGVLLYELLTGQRPFATSGLTPHDVMRTVCETDPLPPSASAGVVASAELQRALRGDLDTVVLMAMRKEPSRRYSSVERFSDDLGRCLTNRPVTAQRDTWRYRATKFATRNRTGLIVCALLLTSLIGGLTATVWQAHIAQVERGRAERRFAEVRSLAFSFLFDVHDAILNLPGSTPARALLVQQGLQSLDGLMREADGDTLLERELAVAYQRLGLVQGNSYNSNLGDSKAALASYQTSVQLLARVTDSTSKNAGALNSLAAAYKGLGDMLIVTGDLSGAVRNLKLSLAVQRRAIALNDTNMEYRRALANLYFVLGDTYGGAGLPNVGDTKDALESYHLAIAERERMLTQLPKDLEIRSGLANSRLNLGALMLSLDDSTGAEHLQQGLAILEQIVVEFPNDANRRSNLLSGYLRLRRPLADAGHFTAALTIDQKVLTMLKQMVAADTKNSLFLRNLGVTYNTLGFDMIGAGQPLKAVNEHRTALAIVERLRAADPVSAEIKQDFAYTLSALADALRESHQYMAAIAEYSRSLSVKLELQKSEPENPRHPVDLVLIYSGRGAARVESDDLSGAQHDFDLALPLAELAVAKPDATSKARSAVALLYSRVGRLHEHQVRAESNRVARSADCLEAHVWFDKSLAAWGTLSTRHELAGANRGQPAIVRELETHCSGG